MTAGRLDEACPKLAESLRLVPGTGTRFNLAECYEKSGKLASAWVNYLDVATEARNAGRPDQEKVARDRASALKPRLATLKIEVVKTSPWLTVERDGVTVPQAQWNIALPIDLGDHLVVAKTPGGATREYPVRIDKERQAESIRIELRDSAMTAPPTGVPTAASSGAGTPPPAPGSAGESTEGASGTVTAGWILTVLGGLTAATGGIVMGVGLGNVASAVDKCPDRVGCSSEAEEEGNQGRTMRDAGGAMLGLGGAALITGIILLAVGGSEEPAPASPGPAAWVSPVVGAGQAGLELGARW